MPPLKIYSQAPFWKTSWPSLVIFIVGALIRALYSFEPHLYLNWDEAPQALMARQIAEGRILPLVHFQLPYIGAVEQYPLALAMLLLGDDIATLRLFYFGLSLISLVAIIALHNRLLPAGWSNLASTFFALSPPIVLLLSLQAYSFGGLVAFTGWALFGLTYLKRPQLPWSALLALGLLNGLSLYNNILSIAVLCFSIWSIHTTGNRDYYKAFGAGFFAGYLPMLGFNLANDFISYKILVAKFLGVTRYMVVEQGILLALFDGLAKKLSGHGPGGFDIAPLYGLPIAFSNSARPLQTAGLIILVMLIAIAYLTLLPRLHNSATGLIAYRYPTRLAYYITTGLLFVLALGQVRYINALLPFLPLVLCEGISVSWQRQRILTTMATAFLLFYLAFAHLAAFDQYRTVPTPKSVHEVFDILREKGLKYGYGSHEYQSSIAFLSREEIKISPQIGPTYMDKIPHFSKQVDQHNDVFYILPTDSSYIRSLIDRDISYQIQETNNAWILWDFSERVYPLDLLSQEELARPDGYYRWSYRENPAVLNPYRGGH
jgi:hypothetical protein